VGRSVPKALSELRYKIIPPRATCSSDQLQTAFAYEAELVPLLGDNREIGVDLVQAVIKG
jgi:hypothetical protein